MEELPGADVQHTVAPGVHEGEDGRGDRHVDAAEIGQQLEPAPLAPCRQSRAGSRPHFARRIEPVMARRPRALPAAHGEKLLAREPAAPAGGAEVAHEREGLVALLADELAPEESPEALK